MLPVARAKLAPAFWLPPVRLAAAMHRMTLSVPLSTIQMAPTLLGSIVRPVDRELAASIVQLLAARRLGDFVLKVLKVSGAEAPVSRP
jgi:hypothetical protein